MMLLKVITENNATYVKSFCEKERNYFSNLDPKLINR